MGGEPQGSVQVLQHDRGALEPQPGLPGPAQPTRNPERLFPVQGHREVECEHAVTARLQGPGQWTEPRRQRCLGEDPQAIGEGSSGLGVDLERPRALPVREGRAGVTDPGVQDAPRVELDLHRLIEQAQGPVGIAQDRPALMVVEHHVLEVQAELEAAPVVAKRKRLQWTGEVQPGLGYPAVDDRPLEPVDQLGVQLAHRQIGPGAGAVRVEQPGIEIDDRAPPGTGQRQLHAGTCRQVRVLRHQAPAPKAQGAVHRPGPAQAAAELVEMDRRIEQGSEIEVEIL